jgi:hypothetical protein
MYIPGPKINIYGTPRFVQRPTLFDESRIKRKPPKSATADESKPGYLCWGTVGDLPSPEPVPTVGFETHTEVSRETTPVRIENPDDPAQYVDALQTNKMKLEKDVPVEKNNSSTTDSNTSSFGDAMQTAATSTKKETYTVNYNPPERAL